MRKGSFSARPNKEESLHFIHEAHDLHVSVECDVYLKKQDERKEKL